MTLLMPADLDAIEAFQHHEAAVLPLLQRHDGRLERRRRTTDPRTDVHIVSFGTRSNDEAYLADAERASHRPLLDGRNVTRRLLEVDDVHGDYRAAHRPVLLTTRQRTPTTLRGCPPATPRP